MERCEFDGALRAGFYRQERESRRRPEVGVRAACVVQHRARRLWERAGEVS
jgi:hypothetical protein